MQPGCAAFDYDAIRNSFLFYKTVTSQYTDRGLLRSIRELVPKEALEGQVVPSLLKWFKGFMTWTPNQIACQRCSTDGSPAFMDVKVEAGSSWRVRKTEVHTCNRCGSRKVIPRYSGALEIAKARYGRCGEWSILFGAVLCSASIKSRIAYDYLDHCWNEVYLDGRWVHVDSTFQYPHSFDNPHYYERNWNKQYVYVLAFSQEGVEDVTERYTEKLGAVMSRRQGLRFGKIDASSIGDLKSYYASIQSEYNP